MFVINIKPTPASRPRVSKRVTYYNEPYRSYKEAIIWAYQSYFEDEVLKTVTKKHKEALESAFAPTGADIDNYAKGLFDGLNGIAFDDDIQIVETNLSKKYSKNSRIEFSISEIL